MRLTSMRALVIKNAGANAVRGLATAAVGLVLPHFLTHALDTDRFAAWSLILQIASYASFLDFGLQTAVARFMAQAMEGQDPRRSNVLVSTALAMLSAAAVLAFGVIALVLWQAPRLFPGITPSLFVEFTQAAFLLACGSCLLLPFSTYTGVLIGLHRNEIPAVCIGASRILGALAVIVAARHTHSLIALAACLTMANLLGALLQVVAVRHLLPSLRAGWGQVQRGTAAELSRYCVGLSVWAFSMLLVSGLDVSIVGHFDFTAVGVYAIAATLTMFYAGLNQSVIGALMTPIAALHARGRTREIGSIVLRVTRLVSVANLLLACGLLLAGPFLLRLWVGVSYAEKAYPLVCLLVVAQVIRLILNPYSTALVACGQQNRAMLPALLEASSNLFLSLAGMILFGPMGVAAGTLAGAVLGVLALLVHTVPRLSGVFAVDARELLQQGLVRPLRTMSPALVSVVASLWFERWSTPLCLTGLLVSCLWAIRSERSARPRTMLSSPLLQ